MKGMNGFIRLKREIIVPLNVLISRKIITGTEYRIVIVIIDNSISWKPKECVRDTTDDGFRSYCDLTISDICRSLFIDVKNRANISKNIKNLTVLGIVSAQKPSEYGKKTRYRPEVDYNKWNVAGIINEVLFPGGGKSAEEHIETGSERNQTEEVGSDPLLEELKSL